MDWGIVGVIADTLAAVGVITSVIYLAVQIRINTRAVQSTSYHQAAEQLWSSSLAVATTPSLSQLLTKAILGQELSTSQKMELECFDHSLLYGFENMLRLHEQGLVDLRVWDNLIQNSMPTLGQQRVRQVLSDRPGPLSAQLLVEVEKLKHLYPDSDLITTQSNTD